MMKIYSKNRAAGQEGFVLITALLFLVILTLIGLAITDVSVFENRIAASNRVQRQTFSRADSGLAVAIEMVEQNVVCPGGFSSGITGFDSDSADDNDSFDIGGINVYDVSFAFDEGLEDVPGGDSSMTLDDDVPSDSVRTIRIPVDPANATDANPRTNLAIYYTRVKYAVGSGLQMAAGYEGIGKGAAGGGGERYYDLLSTHMGDLNSKTDVMAEWRHRITGEINCNY